MARKSRTQPKQSTDTLKALSKVYKTAIYVRLSAEKDETRDRKTLINQRNLIKNFVDQQMDMEVYDIYMDDEISGTTFDRPEFERMMSDMRAGRINCIVVKDLSRLGRDYIETGNLVERVFPMMNIRFVAITDNYDSSKKDADLMVAVTNIANDLYAKDISKKISSSKQEAMEKGIPTGNVAYGYKVVFNENKVKVSYVDETGDAHEKYNFTPVNMEGKEGLYCLGFFETKSHNGKDVNQMRIENIAGCELLKKEESVDDVLVVYCAKHPAHKFTTVVGWYKHATVFRHYQEAVFAPEDIQYYNAIANSSDCVLLPAGIRSRKVQWEVPRKSNGWAYGFGRANVWYASEEDSRLQDYLTRLVKQIDEYDGENWIDKYAE